MMVVHKALSHWEREGPAAKRWEGEGDRHSQSPSPFHGYAAPSLSHREKEL